MTAAAPLGSLPACVSRSQGHLGAFFDRGFASVTASAETRARLDELLDRRILVLDGAMGALIYARKPSEEDYRGQAFRGHPVALQNCTEALVLSQPQWIEDIHSAYLEAGADIVETCTFNATPLALEEFRLQDQVFEINKQAA